MKKALVLSLCMAVLFTTTAASGASSFPDIKNHWAKSVITWGEESGIVSGYPDGKFRPDSKVTEAEFLTMLIKAYLGTPQGDTSNHWAEPIYKLAAGYNLPAQGIANLKARDWYIDRTRVAEIVAGARGVNYTGREAIVYLLAAGLAEGKDPNKISIKGYDGSSMLTRAEALAFIQKTLNNGFTGLKVRPKEPSPPLPHYEDDERIIPNPSDVTKKIPAPPEPTKPKNQGQKTKQKMLGPAQPLNSYPIIPPGTPYKGKIDTETKLSQETIERIKNHAYPRDKLYEMEHWRYESVNGKIIKTTYDPVEKHVGSYYTDEKFKSQTDAILKEAGPHIERKLKTPDWVFIPVPEAFYESNWLDTIYGIKSLRGVLKVKYSSSDNPLGLKAGVWHEGDVEMGWTYGAFLTNNPEDRKPRLQLRSLILLGEWGRIK